MPGDGVDPADPASGADLLQGRRLQARRLLRGEARQDPGGRGQEAPGRQVLQYPGLPRAQRRRPVRVRGPSCVLVCSACSTTRSSARRRGALRSAPLRPGACEKRPRSRHVTGPGPDKEKRHGGADWTPHPMYRPRAPVSSPRYGTLSAEILPRTRITPRRPRRRNRAGDRFLVRGHEVRRAALHGAPGARVSRETKAAGADGIFGEPVPGDGRAQGSRQGS